jgi:hypothetical protein
MKNYRICISINGYTTVQANSEAEALEKAKSLTQVDFDFESVDNDVLSDAVIVDEEEVG